MKFRNTIVMAVALALLGGFVYFYEIRGREAREEAEATAKRLLSFETEELSRVTIEGTEGSVTLERSDDAWRIVAPHAVAADGSAIDNLISALESAEQDRVVVEAAEDLAPFGFDDPDVRATVELADGSTRTLEVGRGTPVGYNVYVRRGDESDVYMTGAGLKDRLDKSLFELRDKRVVTFGEDEVARLELRRGDLSMEVRKQDPEADDSTWQLVTPLATRADDETVESALRRLRTDRASAFVAEVPSDEEVASFGLDDPQVVVTVWSREDASQTIEIGAESEEPAGQYARRRGSSAVFVVPSSLVSALPERVDDLRNRDILDVERDRIGAIDLDTGDSSLRLEKQGTAWRITEPRDLEADASSVSTLITSVLNLRAAEFAPGSADDPAYGLGSPDLELALHLLPAAAAEAEQAQSERPIEVARVRVGAATEATEEEPQGEEEGPQTVSARYVASSADDTVYVVPDEALDDLRVDLRRLRAKTLVSFAQSDVTRIEVEAGATSYALEKAGETWRRTAPEPGDFDDEAVSELFWDFNYLRLEDVAVEWDAGDEPPDLATFGLDAPAYRVRAIIGDDRVADVRLGAPVPDRELEDRPQGAAAEQVYALVDDRPAVFQVARRLLDAVDALVVALRGEG